jgi:hypothetical protein
VPVSGQAPILRLSEANSPAVLKPWAPVALPVAARALTQVGSQFLRAPSERVVRRAPAQTWRDERTDFLEQIWKQRPVRMIERVQIWRNATTRTTCP